MKKMWKRIGTVALAACMLLSMMSYTTAATAENTLTVKVTDTNLGKTVTMENATLLGDNENLIMAIFTIIGADTMGDGIANSYKSNHIAHKGGITSSACTVASCRLYSIWTVELDDWFDSAKEAFQNSAWESWVNTNVDDGLFNNGQSDSDLKTLMKSTDSKISALTVSREYTMTSHNGRYIFSVKRTKPAPAPSGGGSMTTTETIKNEDGSVTTIITDKATGTVTEITTGTNGVTTTTVTEKGTSSPTEVKIPDGADEPVKLPSPTKDKTELNVDVPEGGSKIEIPVNNPSSGNVVVIVHPDGTEEVIKDTKLSENGVVVTLDEDARVKVVNKSKYFIDMDGHWAKDAVDYVAARGLFAGTGVGDTFSPELPMTRGMLAQVIYNMEGAEKHNYVHGFTDIPAGQWYTDAVNWAARENVVAGYGDGSYKPDKLLSREEFAQILYNYAKAYGYDVDKTADLLKFADGAETSWWATAAMQWAVNTGLISGKGGNILGATHTATRAEGAQMFKNFLERIMVD